MKLFRIILSIITIVFASPLHAAPANTTLASLLNNIKTMQADFTQTIYDNKGRAIQISNGQMSLQRPGKLRWQVTKPMPQVIVASDQKLWIYDQDLEQVTIRSLDKTQSEAPALLLSHVDKALENKFIFKTLSAENAHWNWYELTPKQKDSMFATIKMGFYKQQIKEMRLQDQLGHDTKIIFTHIKLNQPIVASKFKLTYPANVDVIDETKARQQY